MTSSSDSQIHWERPVNLAERSHPLFTGSSPFHPVSDIICQDAGPTDKNNCRLSLLLLAFWLASSDHLVLCPLIIVLLLAVQRIHNKDDSLIMNEDY